jgi:hypothetical protein
MTSRPSPQEATALLRMLTSALAGVAVLAGTFTAANVTMFATAHNVPTPIAVLLDPMVALALAIVLLADARLASWGIPPPGWSTALRWFTAITATAMNTWTSLWPNDVIGWPRHADPAGVLLHTVPPVLLILLTETVASYRNQITALKNLPPQQPRTIPQEHPLPTTGSTLPPGTPSTTPPGTATTDGPDTGDGRSSTAQPGEAETDEAVGDDVFNRALRLDAEHRSRTGQSMSIRQLKRVLRVGHTRAKTLRNHLDTHHTGTVPRPLPPTAPNPGSASHECSQTPLDQEE